MATIHCLQYIENLHTVVLFIDCQQDRMREAQLGSHRIQTHGVRLARKHTHDWVVLILLAALVVALHYAPPFSRFVGKDMMTDIRYPVKPSTVPAWAVPVCF
jgi:hypothetical protein